MIMDHNKEVLEYSKSFLHTAKNRYMNSIKSTNLKTLKKTVMSI